MTLTPPKIPKLYTKIHATQLKAQNTHTTQHGRIHKLTSICTTGHITCRSHKHTWHRTLPHGHTATTHTHGPRTQEHRRVREACLTQKLRLSPHLRPRPGVEPQPHRGTPEQEHGAPGGGAGAASGPGWRWEAIPVQGQCCSPNFQPQAQALITPLTGHHDQPLSTAATPLLRSPSHARMTHKRLGEAGPVTTAVQKGTRKLSVQKNLETLFTRGFWAADHLCQSWS